MSPRKQPGAKGAGHIDFAAVNAAALAGLEGLVMRWLPEGRKEGDEWVALNPTRNDTRLGSFRINLTTGRWADFSTNDRGGDPISLYTYLQRVTGDHPQAEGARMLAADLGTLPAEPASSKRERAAPREEWRPIMPVPDDAPEPLAEYPRKDKGGKWHRHPIAARWAYRDAAGKVLGYTNRINLPDGKDVVPLTYCESVDTGTGEVKRAWKWRGMPAPRPLYGLDRLTARPDCPNVMLVEGEAKADAWQDLPSIVVLAWPGGSKAIDRVDLSPLRGKRVIGWPDADRPGWAAMCGELDAQGRVRKGFAQLLDGLAAGFRMIAPPAGVPEAWDLKDARAEGWDAPRVMAHIKANMRQAEPLPYLAQPALTAPEPAPAPAATPQPEPAPAPAAPEPPPHDAQPADYGGSAGDDSDHDAAGLEAGPFRLLGYDHGQYFYMANGSKQVTALTPSAHTKNNLLALAPLQWWERRFSGRNGPSWDAAANALIQQSHTLGPFDPTRIRGRGAWWDDGSAVLHLGDRVVVDGQSFPVEELDSRYIYEAAAALRTDMDNPLSAGEAVELVKLCDMLSWEKPINAKLLAGWCMVAPICGALDWRPHIWITGGSGVGKTWIMEKIVQRSCGDAGLYVQSETTEAGLRQMLGHDARPVVFDEAESESIRSRVRVENVMALMRQASSENGAVIIKGSATGAAQSFQIRSCFAFASIAVGAQQFADKSRVSVLGLRKNADANARKRFEEIKVKWLQVMTDDYVQRLHARAFKLIPVIRKNAETFAVAGAERLGGQRMGDQVGALLSGAYALHSNKIITIEDAREWVAKQDWTEEAGLQQQRDEEMCLAFMMESLVRVQGIQASIDRSVGELVQNANRVSAYYDDAVSHDSADGTLRRMGFRVNDEGTHLLISNSHSAIARMLRDTPWVTSWARILRRLDGAQSIDQPVRFGAGNRSRAVAVPLTLITDE